MVRGSNPVKVREWVDRLMRRGESDGSVAEFCEAEGVSVASFYQWQRKLRDAAVSKDTKTLAAGSAGGSSASRASDSGAGGLDRTGKVLSATDATDHVESRAGGRDRTGAQSAGGSSASRASASGIGGTKRRVGFQAVDVTSAGALGSSAAAVTVCLPGGIQVQVADNLPAIQAVMRELISAGRVGSETPAC